MDILAKRPNLLFLIAVRVRALYKKLLFTRLRENIYCVKYRYVWNTEIRKEFMARPINRSLAPNLIPMAYAIYCNPTLTTVFGRLK